MNTIRRTLPFSLLLLLVVFIAPGPASSALPPAAPATGANDGDDLALPTRQIIIKYRADAFVNGATGGPGPDGAAQMARLSEAAGAPLTYFRPMSGDAHVLRLPTRLPLAEVQALADRLSALPEVLYAEPDAIMLPALTPNDPRYNDQWHYTAPGSNHYGINAPAAWDITTGSASIIVAVVDTGITNHADLAGRTVAGYDFITEPLVANDGDGRDSDASDPGDWITAAESGSGFFQGCQVSNSSWHGTHVAGTIGAASNNSVGVAGVNWNSRIQPVRVLGKCGGVISDIADGMRWAAGLPVPGALDNLTPAKVINASLGGTGACGSTYQDAINAIVGAGATAVIAAGNSNANAANYRPGNCDGVITVAATNRAGSRAYYSNYGSVIEISAPGGETNLTSSNGVLSTLNTGTREPVASTYTYYQGTSMAAPHVAGVASLLYSLNPAITPAQVLAILQSTVTPFPGGSTCNTSNCGSGIVNAGAAAAAMTNPTPTIVSIHPSSATPGSGSFTLFVNGAGFVAGSVVRWNGANRTTTYVNSTQLTAAINAGDVATAGAASVTVFNPAPGGGTSNAATFTIGNPAPAATWHSPFWAAPGGPAFTLTVNGAGFVAGSVVRWNGADRATSFVNATQLTAAILQADIAASGTATITVFNPPPGGGLSNPISFLIGAPRKVYLPITLKNYPPLPAGLTLNPIDNADGDGDYTVSWTAAASATSYILQEDDNSGFTSPTEVYSGGATSWPASGKATGAYFYRAQGRNAWGGGPWSNVVSTVVQPPISGPNPGYWRHPDGRMEFYVTADRAKVERFAIRVNIEGCGSYKITHLIQEPIITGVSFSFTGPFYASGVFSSQTAASGTTGLNDFFISGCGSVTGGPWDWTATWMNTLAQHAPSDAAEVVPVDLEAEAFPAARRP